MDRLFSPTSPELRPRAQHRGEGEGETVGEKAGKEHSSHAAEKGRGTSTRMGLRDEKKKKKKKRKQGKKLIK